VYLILHCCLADFPPKYGVPTGLQVATSKEKNSQDILEYGLQILLHFPDYVAVVLALVWSLWIGDTTNTVKHQEGPGCMPSYSNTQFCFNRLFN